MIKQTIRRVYPGFNETYYGYQSFGEMLKHTEELAYPGSPDSPPSAAQREAKVRDCLAYYERRTGNGIDYEYFQGFVEGLLSPARRLSRAAAGD